MYEDENCAPWLDGWITHRDAKGPNAGLENPYNEVTQPYSHFQWMMGWTRRNDACNHGWDLTYDA